MLAPASSSFCLLCRRSARLGFSPRRGYVPQGSPIITVQGSAPELNVEKAGLEAKPKQPRKRRKAEKAFSPVRSKAVTAEVITSSVSVVEPTLADLQMLRPQTTSTLTRSRAARILDGPKYAKLYEDTINVVCRSFTRSQLASFTDELRSETELKLDQKQGSSVRKKKELAQEILLGWGLNKPDPSLQRDKPVEHETKEFPLLPSELFLLMGPDGSDLLRLSHRYQVRLEPLAHPLRLLAAGTVKSLEQLADEIDRKQKGIYAKTVKLQRSDGVRPDLIQTISRLSGAFIENIGDEKLRITANHEVTWERARRLAEKSGSEGRASLYRPLLAHLTPPQVPSGDIDSESIAPHLYGLYPFLIPGPLPWTIGYANPFRARRVFDWLSEPGSLRARREMHLTNGEWLSKDGKPASLTDTLLGALPSVPEGWTRSLTAIPGYLLVTRVGGDPSKMSLVPPLLKTFQFQTFLDYLKSGRGILTLLPGVPAAVRAETLKYRGLTGLDDVIIYRLRYQAKPVLDGVSVASSPDARASGVPESKAYSPSATSERPLQAERIPILEFEINLTRAVTRTGVVSFPATTAESIGWTTESEQQNVSTVGGLLDEREPNDGHEQPRVAGEQAGQALTGRPTILSHALKARVGYRGSVDVLLPERPLDLRISVSDLVSLTEIPEVVSQHFGLCLAAHSDNRILPDSPFSVEHNGVLYELESSSVVRTSMVDQVVADRIIDGSLDGFDGKSATVVVEEVADVDTKQERLQCKVHALAPTDDEIWSEFLAQCEQLTSLAPQESILSLFERLSHIETLPTTTFQRRAMYG